MLIPPRVGRLAAVAAVTAVALVAPALAAGAATPGDQSGAHASSPALHAGRDGADGTLDGTANIYDGDVFRAPDGLYYKRSPLLVPGLEGISYMGEELDVACAVGRRLGHDVRALDRLARTIERTGRKVVFTVAPNKSAVNKRDLPATFPHGTCDSLGIAAQDAVLDGFRSPRYIQTRRKLEAEASTGAGVYWRTDTHWTTLATAKYAEELARHLRPRLGRIQRFKPGEQTILVDLSFLGLISQTYETMPARYSATKVRVTPAPGSKPYDADVVVSTDLAWNAGPASRTWPGHTLLLGDSFTYRGLDSLMPLFRHGHFLWTGNVPKQSVVAAIPTADTVVIEIVQRYTPFSILVQPQFRETVKRALHAYDKTHRSHR
jgi:alginate O-acetyltransferase complex protein AlgJ